MKLIFILLMLILDGIGKVKQKPTGIHMAKGGLQSPFMKRYEWLLKVISEFSFLILVIT